MEQAAPVRCTEGRRNRRRSGRMERGMWHGGDDAEDDADHEENAGVGFAGQEPVMCTDGRRGRRSWSRSRNGMEHGEDDAEDDADHEENGDDAEENAATCCIGGAC